MIDELWNEIIARLTPKVRCFSAAESLPITMQIWKFLKYPYGSVDWEKYPQHERFNESSEIIPILEKFLGKTFDDTVYMYSEDFVDIIKGSLRVILEDRYHFQTPLWFWSPTGGFIVEERSTSYKTIGLVPKIQDPFETFTLKKDSFCSGIFHQYSLTNQTAYFGIKMFDARNANDFLVQLQKITPLTSWGNIDWGRIEKKIVIGVNPTEIIPALEKLTGNVLDQAAYVEWCDADLPLISGNLEQLLAHYRELTALSLGTIIFNLTTPYIIEINVSGTITVGILTRSDT